MLTLPRHPRASVVGIVVLLLVAAYGGWTTWQGIQDVRALERGPCSAAGPPCIEQVRGTMRRDVDDNARTGRLPTRERWSVNGAYTFVLLDDVGWLADRDGMLADIGLREPVDTVMLRDDRVLEVALERGPTLQARGVAAHGIAEGLFALLVALGAGLLLLTGPHRGRRRPTRVVGIPLAAAGVAGMLMSRSAGVRTALLAAAAVAVVAVTVAVLSETSGRRRRAGTAPR